MQNRLTNNSFGRLALLTYLIGGLAACTDAATDNSSAATAAAQDQQTDLADYLTRPVEDDVIYFMLPDRFANGDTGNDTGGYAGGPLQHGFDPTHRGFYHGGDLKGLTEKLDYIQGLGASAIWLGPIFKNKPVQGGPGSESSGYHGYWITDFTDVDPHLGTRADLKEFVDAAHERNMKVYMDIITNHSADVIKYQECHDPATPPGEWDWECPYRSLADYPYTTVGGPDGAPINADFLGDEDHLQTPENFGRLTRTDYAYTPYLPAGEEDVKVPAWTNDPRYYHNRGNTTFEGESSLYGDFAGLDDFNTEHPRVVSGFIEIFQDWISEYRIDGFRIDTTRHINSNFWRQFLPAMKEHAASIGIPNFYMFGEVYNFNPAALARFTHVDGFDQLLDFATQSALFDIVTTHNTDRMDALLDADPLYRDSGAARLPTFLGNHDMGRISGMIKDRMPDISQEELLARTRIAHELLIMMRGVPVIYSGDEQGFVSDGGDQLARENMFASQVAEYNDNDLIGTDATTADENYDRNHPLYQAIARAAAVRHAHPALSRAEMVPRLSEREGHVFAFSRFDPESGHEYLVAVNTGATARSVNVRIDAASRTFSSLMGQCPGSASTPGSAALSLEPFSLSVCRSNEVSSRAGGL